MQAARITELALAHRANPAGRGVIADLVSARIIVEDSDLLNEGNNGSRAVEATLKTRVRMKDGAIEEVLHVSEGVGPVDALSGVIKKTFSVFSPKAYTIQIVDYAVIKLNGGSFASEVEVSITLSFEEKLYVVSSQGKNQDTAAARALILGFEYLITR